MYLFPILQVYVFSIYPKVFQMTCRSFIGRLWSGLPRYKCRQGGLTLLELLLALVIIGLLAGIAVPSYREYFEKQKRVEAANDIKALSVSIESYMLDHDRVYPENLAQIGNESFLDPWGRPYQYYNVARHGKGGSRKDKNLNPLNTDFDLYSMGKDGESKKPLPPKVSHDDIIRANNGRYIGLASEY